jgi:ABC-2 type transport system ATP-binding protein
MSLAVRVLNLSKVYRVPVREAGIRAALRSLVSREMRSVEAVKEVSFDVAEGEVIGFLGPNGAGKTTSLKMLSGLLHPSSGEIEVLGHVPHKRDNEFLRQITLVMGQRNQLMWDIPVIDSLERNRAIYRIDRDTFKTTLDELVELLDLEALIDKPVRNLSLGERMKCEFAAALLHQPRVLFLDEPTIGLDVTMQRRIRSFIERYNRTSGATVLLTSHYMADVEALCRRVVVIHHGSILFDGQLEDLVQSFSAHKTITLDLDVPADADGTRAAPDLARYGEIVAQQGARISLRVPKRETASVTSRLLAEYPVLDLSIEDPPIEEVIDRVFSEEGLVAAATSVPTPTTTAESAS